MTALDGVLSEIGLAVDQAGPGRLLLGVDGVDGVGKTTVAEALADSLRAAGRDVLRVSLDDFLQPAERRYARGRDSATGYYLDSVDLAAFLDAVVRPLRDDEPRIRTAVFDHRTDTPVDVPPVWVPEDAVIVVDGMFLHRRELAALWDVSVFLDAPFEVTVARTAQRDGGSPDPDDPANRRYVEGQGLYLDECRPAHLATVVVDLTDPDHPLVVAGE
ncbi:uridine kinase [Actinotalea sp. M2MS4P-6]|uniref:uridine kinase n=1 Tax=Actinotalea sp. M2MS4P-6 TaxID=2983762 RepID=UPI0021E3BCE1|nr:uridine kinase [Actinotalea sp. M2MS4P-6]MCV2394023.1 uridine kinase [Actinotalea sp. M2MS4P-6]